MTRLLAVPNTLPTERRGGAGAQTRSALEALAAPDALLELVAALGPAPAFTWVETPLVPPDAPVEPLFEEEVE